MARIVRVFTVLPATQANGMSHAFAFPAEAGPHFTDPEGAKG